MPSDYQCDDCELQFSIGGYHYDGWREGYGARELVVCGDCGRQHGVEVAAHPGPEFYERFCVIVDEASGAEVLRDLARTVRDNRKCEFMEAVEIVRNRPFVLSSRALREDAYGEQAKLAAQGVSARVELEERTRNPNFGPPKSDRLLYLDRLRLGGDQGTWLVSAQPVPEPRSGASLEALRCEGCGRQGRLLAGEDDRLDEMPCPRCSARARLTTDWIS